MVFLLRAMCLYFLYLLALQGAQAANLAPSGVLNLTVASAPETFGNSPTASFAPLAKNGVQTSGRPSGAPNVAPGPAGLKNRTHFLNPTDYEVPACNGTKAAANLSDWKRWSDLSTWPGASRVPGTNGSLDNVTISCGDYILYDMPLLPNGSASVELSWLLVSGHLMFEDSPKLPTVALTADHIIVTGNFTIGSRQQHYRQKARITLMGRSKNVLPGYEDIGFKVFAVAGGQVNFYGMPNGSTTAAWVSLTQLATAGATSLFVDQDISTWPVGGEVAIASTDYDALQTETAKIVAASGNKLTLDKPLKFSRFAPSVPIGYKNLSMPMAAEVALLTRNIRITATLESSPQQVLIGGHFIVYNTPLPQAIFGVEFSNLGQQGTLGRYPLHFHLCGAMPGSTVKSNVVRDSFQRAYVIHGTHWLTAENNIAFNVTGHAFVFEDGVEQNNTLRHNLVISSKPATLLIQQSGPPNTDNTPSCFWTNSPTNNWINNTAVGCTSGFWMELNQAVRGASAVIPGASTINPFEAPMGKFIDNTAHSNDQGLQMYQHGYMPPSNTTFLRFKAYKNSEYGIVMHGCTKMIVDGAMIADSLTGVEFNEQSFNTLQNSIIIGQSLNLGNPLNCASPYAACEPVSGTCGSTFNYLSVPNAPGPGYRTVPADAKKGVPQYGVVLAANTAAGNVFVNFSSTCLRGGAIGTDAIQPGAIPVTGVVWNNTFINTPLDNRAYIDPALSQYLNQYWAARDSDGTTIGTSGYLVANGSALLMPSRENSTLCQDQNTWNGYSCKDVCYRSVFVEYLEPALEGIAPSVGGTVLNLTRVTDLVSQIMPGGNMQANVQMAGGLPFWKRVIYINLLGGHDYNVAIQGGAGKLPAEVTYGYTDNTQPSSPPCSARANLIFPREVNAAEQQNS